ncbi:MAG: hypothetical protein QF454_05080 [Candidatus Thalassarchaeaceae archaeon]|jgi:hypothetical protein|nr:hypothetical protein [Candidatus Thalassarchaeaceae archaeon]
MGGSTDFESRTNALRNRGFAVETPVGEFASEKMIHLENEADLAAEIRSKVLELPPHWDEVKVDLLRRLIDPENAGAIHLEFQRLLRQHRPWVMMAERSRVKWSDEGRSVELSRLLNRLDAIDEALVLASPRIIEMIGEVAPWRNIEPVLIELEVRYERRLSAMNGMLKMLEKRGWDTSELSSGILHERFTVAEQLQRLDVRLSGCQRKIEADVRPFDGELAERLWVATNLTQREKSSEAMARLENEIENAATDLVRRLAVVEGRIDHWKNDGFQLEVSLPLLPSEMMYWEARLSDIAERVEVSHAIWARMEGHLIQWPEFRELAERTKGHLDALDSLEVLLHGLESKTDGAMAECYSRLETWAASGIETEHWVPIIEREPRRALDDLNRQDALIGLIIPLIDELKDTDVSIRGGDGVEHWLAILRNRSAGVDDIHLAREWLDRENIRAARHRIHLDGARRDLATLWPKDVDSESLSLAEYEQMVSTIEGNGSITLDGDENDGSLSRVVVGVEKELEEWELLGWSTVGLRELLEQDPVRLGLDLPHIRIAMEQHDERLDRLEPLPWGLDVELAEGVLSDLRCPERLPGIDDQFASLVKSLAKGGGVADPDFVFAPFRPIIPRVKMRKLPVLEPVVVVAEAIIDDVPEEIIEEVVEDIVEEIEDRVEDDVVIEEVMEENTALPIHLEKEEVSDRLIQMFEVDEVALVDPSNIMPPLDVRVQRLLRLSWIVSKSNMDMQNILFGRLEAIARLLKNWIAERLSQRNASSNSGFLENAYQLAEKLSEIPGPGVAIPLDRDLTILPEIDDRDGLANAIARLERAVRLPSARISTPEEVEV